MIKLLKYELKNMYLPYVIVSVLYLACMLIISIYGELKGYGNIFSDNLGATTSFFIMMPFLLAIFGAILAFLGLFIVIVVSVINSFSKYFFGSYGSLLLSLPIKLDYILLSKILSNVICIACATLFYIFCLIQVFSSFSDSSLAEFYSELFKTVNELSVGNVLLFCFYWFANIGNFLMMILLTLTLLNIWHINSFVFPIGLLIYFCLSFAIGFLTSIIDVTLLSSTNANILENINSYYDGDALNIYLFYQGFKAFILCILIYLLSRFLILRKMELS